MNAPHAIFDRRLLAQRKKRAPLAAHDFLFRESAARLADRLDDVTRAFPLAVELGAHGDILAQAVHGHGGIERLVRLAGTGRAEVIGDEETVPFADNSVDLVISNLALHWVNDLPGTLAQIQRMLKPDGLFLATLPGGSTLFELREALDHASLQVTGGVSPRISPFVDVRDAGSLLQRAGFALPVVDADRLTVSYENLPRLLADLRGAGEANALTARSRTPLRRDVLGEAAQHYRQRFADETGRLSATFELVTLTGWKPHSSQPQPAKRGSGKIHLGEHLTN